MLHNRICAAATIMQPGSHLLSDVQDKIDVNGPDAHPLWTFMKEQTKSGDIKWNYTKFLIDRNGVPRKCFNSLYDPIDFEDDVGPGFPLFSLCSDQKQLVTCRLGGL